MGLVEGNNQSVGYNSKAKLEYKISKPKLFVLIAIPVVALVLLSIFVIYPALNRSFKETTYQKALQNHESEELMSGKLADKAKLYYEKGNFDSIKPYIEETLAIYSDGYAKLEVLNDVNEMLYAADDWVSLRQLYDLIVETAEKSEVDEDTIDYFRDLAMKARTHE